MRAETALANGVEVKERGGATLLKRQPGGPWSAAADMDSQPFGQNGAPEEFPSSPQNGGSLDLIATNPFHAYCKESTNNNVLESGGTETSEEADVEPMTSSPLKYLNSLQDLGYGIRKTENGAKLSEHLDSPQTYDPKDELFRPSSLSFRPTTNGDFHDTALKNTNSAQSHNFSEVRQTTGSGILTDDVDAIFRLPSKEKDLSSFAQTVTPNPFSPSAAPEADLFSNEGNELFHVNGTRKEAPSADDDDLSGKSVKEKFDLFSSLSTSTVDPFPSPLLRSPFNVSSLEDPFGPTPSKQYDFQEVFSSPREGKDIFETTPSNATFSTPSINGPSKFNFDTPASSDPVKKTPPKVPSRLPPVIPPKPPNKPRDLLTTPQGSKQNILCATPFSQANSLSSSPSFSPADMDHVQTFKRPPRPLPRTRRPRAERPPLPETPPKPARPRKPERPLPSIPSTKLEPEVPGVHGAGPEVPKPPPKPVIKPPPKPVPPLKPKKPESKLLEPENEVVFENVLLIGQECCVEDWPEDSPELDPDYQPLGKFKLRRESMKVKMESDGGSSEDPDGTFGQKKKDKKLRMSLLSRRSSKDKYPNDMMEGKGNTLPALRKSSKEFGSNGHISTGDEDHYSLDYKKKTPKTKVNHLFRRASLATATCEEKHMNGHLPKDSDSNKSRKKNSILRRQSEGSTLDGKDYEETEKGGRGQRRNSKVKVKFVPQRGFAISLEKPHDEPQGAHGYTPRKGSKDKSLDEDCGAHGYTPCDKLQELDLEEMEGLSLNSAKASILDDEQQDRYSPSLNGDDDVEGAKKHKHKKSKRKVSLPRKSKASHGQSEGGSDDETTEKDVCHGEEYDDPDEIENIKPKKSFKFKVPKKHKRKSKKAKNQPGEAPDEHLSEAAKAAWAAAQMDEQAMAGMEDEEEEEEEEEEENEVGDTDSLMEWWYTVEKWDELPSDEEDAALKEDESKSFTVLADKVEHGLRLFNKVFTEQAESLWEHVILLHALADDISEFHHKAKIAGISGGTTTAVGTVTAITGLALAPFTFGASLVVAAVGVGVATAGGITSASAAISDNVHDKNERKKIEALLQEYEERLLELSKILHFVNQGLYRLRGHPFLRSGTQHYSQDWEVRKAVQMISMVDSPVMRATEIADNAVGSLQGLFKGMDKYFVKETRELKKSCRKEIVGEIRQVASVLNDAIVELNTIREELQDATGHV
ncbi:histone-lysine N-methyltransferase SETD1B isoform X2 [Fundulus heteroclitus]|uniref:histone-lysine N-methyltransferase SETD1B isoform X2 n=1 Tax=Fundulus heteroclitus TaxID=8078 RepID=UPI00165C33B9|nr:histone-lysine N-methyltransferase SETD1B isoform X2 [Fundulus heteroclitus]